MGSDATPFWPKKSQADPSPRRHKPRRKLIVPQIGSLYDILHDHCHQSLYVLPIVWTDLHAEILKTRFLQRSPITTPKPTPVSSQSPRRSLITPHIVEIGRNVDVLLAQDTPLVTKNRAMHWILSTFYPEHLPEAGTSCSFAIRFGKKYYPCVARCQTLWNQVDPWTTSFDSATTWADSQSDGRSPSMLPTPSRELPLLAYINRSHLDHIRKNCFRVLSGPDGQFNDAVYRLQVLRSKNLLPKNPDEDAYIIAVLLLMAQKSVYENLYAGTGFAPRDVTARVLTVDEEGMAFIVYTATIPAALLSMFHEPDVAPLGDTEIRVEYCRVPVWPVLGLKERLGKALGADVVGNFEGVPMDRFVEKAPPPMSNKRKRRRAALAEVFNTSFSEDRDTDAPTVSEPFMKRRCREKVRLGVVQ